jgi:hypothetical protein
MLLLECHLHIQPILEVRCGCVVPFTVEKGPLPLQLHLQENKDCNLDLLGGERLVEVLPDNR